MSTKAILFFLSITAASAQSGELKTPAQLEKKVLSDVYLAPDAKESQIEELLRQLRIPAMVDMGDRSAVEIDDDKPEWKVFAHKKGTVAEILTSFCKTRFLRWRIWPEGKAFWIEPSRVADRTPRRYLQRKLKLPLAFRVDERVKGWLLAAYELGKIWKDAKTLADKGVVFSISKEGFKQHAQNPIVFKKPLRPKNIMDVVAYYLSSSTTRIAMISITDASPKNKQRVTISLGQLFPEITSQKNAFLIRGLYSGELPKGYAVLAEWSRQCENELYRRYQVDPKAILQAFKESKWYEKADDYDLAFIPKDFLLRWDVDAFGQHLIEAFKTSPPDVQKRMLKNDFLPYPDDYKGKFLPFWKGAAKSKNKDLKAAAIEVLKTYEILRKVD